MDAPQPPPSRLEVHAPDGRTFGQRREIGGLSPLAHRLVRHMADRSRANGGVPVACPHEELIRAVWGDGETTPHGFTAEHLRDLVSDLRKRLEPDCRRGEASRLLQTVPGFGYRLMVCAGDGQ